MGFCTVGLDETVGKCRETAFTDMLWGWNLPFGQISRRLVVILPSTIIVEVSRNLVGMTPRYMIAYKNVFVRVDSSYGAEQIAKAVLCAGLPARERVRYQKESGREAHGARRAGCRRNVDQVAPLCLAGDGALKTSGESPAANPDGGDRARITNP